MLAIRGSYGCGIVARRVRMKYPYVKKCVLTSIPEISCANIKASITVEIGRTIGEGLTIKLLKSWFGGNAVTNFSKKCCSNVTNFVMAKLLEFPPCGISLHGRQKKPKGHHNCMISVCCTGSIRNVGIIHRGTLPCAAGNRARQLAEQRAKPRTLSPGLHLKDRWSCEFS